MGKDGNNIDPDPLFMWTHILYNHLRSAPSCQFVSAVHAISGKTLNAEIAQNRREVKSAMSSHAQCATRVQL
jgi:hypothetical protein